MIAWSRRRTLIAGVALILAVNVILLAGVAYNRSGDRTSSLQLSEREARLPYGRWDGKENSGVVLSLVWRIRCGNDTPEADYGAYGAADWLDQGKLLALGFDLSPDRAERKFKQWRTKEVLLIPKLDGLGHRQSLARAQKRGDDEEKLNLANPGNAEVKQRAPQAKENADHEEHENSRLFIIDAGLDAETLRAQYPDPAHDLTACG